VSPPKRVRVRKARHKGVCPRCRRYILAGELIASVRGGPFMYLAHITREHTDGKDNTMSSGETDPIFSFVECGNCHGSVIIMFPPGDAEPTARELAVLAGARAP